MIAQKTAELIESVYNDPVLFVRNVIGAEPDEWQIEALNALVNNSMVTIKSGHGVGKTAFEAWAILWYISCRYKSKILVTAPTKQQLYDVLWSEIAKWLEESPLRHWITWTKTKLYMNEESATWFASAKTASRVESMQGWHADHLLVVVDEASGIDDEIMEALLATMTGRDNRMVMCGNPIRLTGVFYDSHNRDALDYYRITVNAKDSNRTSKMNIARLERRYGEDSDIVKMRVLGEFPSGESNTFISRETITLAQESVLQIDPTKVGTTLHLGVDVARYGEDSTVITPRIDHKMLPYWSSKRTSITEVAGKAILMIRQLKDTYKQLRHVVVKIDDTGMGGGVTDILYEQKRQIEYETGMKVEVVPVNNGASATDPYYANLGAQVWGEFKRLAEDNFTAIMQGKEPTFELPPDDFMLQDLTERKYYITSQGKIALESKDDMKARGVPSPDIADSITLAFYEPSTHKVNIQKGLW